MKRELSNEPFVNELNATIYQCFDVTIKPYNSEEEYSC